MGAHFDDSGLFWTTEQRALRGTREDPVVALTKRLSGMVFDDSYVTPDLRDPPPGCMALDFETEDPQLMKRGSSWAFSDGQIIGIAVAWDGFEAYYAIRHCGGNIDPVPVLAWLRRQLQRSDLIIVCAHAVYDIGWARRELGLYPAGGVEDVQFMAALLDEYRFSYSLESIAQTYLGVGKETTRLDEIEKRLNVKHTLLMSCLKHLPGPAIARYAAIDARRTYDLRKVLIDRIEGEGLQKVHALESGLIPVSTEMRRVGVRVDVDEAQRLSDFIKNERMPALQDEIKRQTGVQVEPWEAETVEAALAEIGVTCRRTREGKPEVKADFLEAIGKVNIIGTHILRLRKLSKAAGTFLDGHILSHQEKGRLHANFNQLRSERNEGDGYGTVTGRYSITDPGLQQIPVRDEEIGPMIRGIFQGEEGEEVASIDFKSQEPRLIVHFAYKMQVAQEAGDRRLAHLTKVRGAREVVAQYIAEPNTDFHTFVASLCGIKRPAAKAINLGLGYGMGGAKLAHSLGLPSEWMRISQQNGRSRWKTIDAAEVAENRANGYQVVEVAGPEAKKIISAWEKGAPFIRGLQKVCMEIAQERGFIRTIANRRCRFPSDGAGGYDWAHKSLNRLCQSSGADQMKLAMLEMWKAGVTPRLTVHDELLFSVASREQAQQYVPYMEHAVELVVPSVVDIKFGRTWGDIPK